MNTFIFYICQFIILNILRQCYAADNNIWVPPVGTTWNWILNAEPNEISCDDPVDMLDIDLFDHSAETVNKLHKAGKKVICYFSAGTYENERPDSAALKAVPNLVRNNMEEWDEKYLDIRIPELKPIMEARLDFAKEKGCDGVEPDNIDIYLSNPVKKWKDPITKKDQLDYDIWLTSAAHARNLSIAMKNDIANANVMVSHFDFAINEECYDFNECDAYVSSFIKNKKAVFVAAYGDGCDEKFLSKLEKNTKGRQLSIIIKNEDQSLKHPYVTFNPENYDAEKICEESGTLHRITKLSFILSFIFSICIGLILFF